MWFSLATRRFSQQNVTAWAVRMPVCLFGMRSQVVEMHESPAAVARKKRDSSIWIATELVKSGEAQAVVSAGNTGASMVASFFMLGLTRVSSARPLPPACRR